MVKKKYFCFIFYLFIINSFLHGVPKVVLEDLKMPVESCKSLEKLSNALKACKVKLKDIFANIPNSFNTLMSSATCSIGKGKTAVGRAFQKHCARKETAFVGVKTGNAKENSEQGLGYLNMILGDPSAVFIIKNTSSYGQVVDVRLANGMGARWSSGGEKFIGFLESLKR